ncbi:MAG: hypothetical protein ACFE9C_06145 [Candidatus Hodarchaeota archaeon]
MLKYTINKFLDLRFEDGKTNIYVNNELFRHCKYILLNISNRNSEYDPDIDSVDDIIEPLNGSFGNIRDKTDNITPEMMFWAHCSNLQAWYENNYNTRLIHSNLSFPLLKQLTKAGDLIARKVFKEEIAIRFESNNITIMQFLLYNGYLDYLNKEEIEIVLIQIKVKFSEIIVNQLNYLMKSPFTNYYKIKYLIDLMLFIDLKYNGDLIFCIIDELNEMLRIQFVNFLILHLNFKEFIDYKIPYGKFFVYFEKILDNIYDEYPEIKDFLKNIDSGFLSGSLSLDEAYSYGTQSYP